MKNNKYNKRIINYQDIDRFIEEASKEVNQKENLLLLLYAFLDNLILYGIEDDYDNFGSVLEYSDRQKIIDFLFNQEI